MAEAETEAKIGAVRQFFEPQQWDSMQHYHRLQTANIYYKYITMLPYRVFSKPHFVRAYERRKEQREKLDQQQTKTADCIRLEVEEDVGVAARSTASATVYPQQVKMEITIVECQERGEPVCSRAVDQRIQQPENVPIAARNTASDDVCSLQSFTPVKTRTQPTHNKQFTSPVKTSVGRVHKCKECGVCYGRPSLLENHMKTKHTVTAYQCDICKKCFCRAREVERHISTVHHGAKPFHCPTCEKSFGLKCHLDGHIRSIHEGEKFECEQCGKKFPHKSSLKQHALVHTGEKPHVCEICGKRFSTSGNLATHRHRHLQIKPHQCPGCHMTFVTASNMKKHMRRMHATQ